MDLYRPKVLRDGYETNSQRVRPTLSSDDVRKNISRVLELMKKFNLVEHRDIVSYNQRLDTLRYVMGSSNWIQTSDSLHININSTLVLDFTDDVDVTYRLI